MERGYSARETCVFFLLLLGLHIPRQAEAAFQYLEDFSGGLGGVTVSGSVADINEEARLGDDDGSPAYLYPAVQVPLGAHILEFDFSNGLSSEVPQGSFADTFFASLYFINDVNQFDLLGNVADDVMGLMDLDFLGAFNVNGQIGASLKGNGWSHFSATFDNSYAYVIPAFELHDLNAESGDSSVLIDNILIQTIPEPATAVVMALGMAFAALVHRCRRGRTCRTTLPA